MSSEPEQVIELSEVIDLSDIPDPSIVEITCSSAIARAAGRALTDLESHHGNGPWIAVCTANKQLIAASPTFDAELHGAWTSRFEGNRWEQNSVPLAVIALGTDGPMKDGSPIALAAQLVNDALCEIVLAERRAAVANARAGRAEAMASTDALTGVGNQRAWWDRIAEEEAHRTRSARSSVIAVIDLDDLKMVNDERGHLHGDLLLRLAAQTLRRTLRGFDIVARVGGDEFAVLAIDYEGEPHSLGERLGKALEAADIHASIGIAVPTPTMSLTEAFAVADKAMYASKRRRRQPSGA